MSTTKNPAAGRRAGLHLRAVNDESTLDSTTFADAFPPFEIDGIESVSWGSVTHKFLLKLGGGHLAITCCLAVNRDGESFVAPKSTKSQYGRFERCAEFSPELQAAVLDAVYTRLGLSDSEARVG